MAAIEDYLMKEMELIQDCFNKYDDWIIRIRTGFIVGLSALASVPLIESHHIPSLNLVVVGLLFTILSYGGEGVTRQENWIGYVKRKKEIENYLAAATKPADFGLYVVKSPARLILLDYRKCWVKIDSIIFNVASFVVFWIVVCIFQRCV